MHSPLSSKETALCLPRPDRQGSHRSVSFSSPHENRFAGFSRGPHRSCRKEMRRARWKRKALGASNSTRSGVKFGPEREWSETVLPCLASLLLSASDTSKTRIEYPRICYFRHAFGTVDAWTSVSFRCRSRHLPVALSEAGSAGLMAEPIR